jgi:hypothetical protein
LGAAAAGGNNTSAIEQRRGGGLPSDDSSSTIIQIPNSENTIDLTTKSYHEYKMTTSLSQINSVLLSEFSRTKLISSFPKKLNFLDQTNETTVSTHDHDDDTATNVTANITTTRLDKSKSCFDNQSDPDEDEPLQELLGDQSDDANETMLETDYFQILDRNLEREKLKKRNKHLNQHQHQLLQTEHGSCYLDSFKSKNATAWEISPTMRPNLSNEEKRTAVKSTLEFNYNSNGSGGGENFDLQEKLFTYHKYNLKSQRQNPDPQVDHLNDSQYYTEINNEKIQHSKDSDNENEEEADAQTNSHRKKKFETPKTLLTNSAGKALVEKNDFNNQHDSDLLLPPPGHPSKPKSNFEFMHKFKSARQEEKNKENYLSEASTQTSFVESSESSSAASSLAGSLSSGEIKKKTTDLQKQRLKKEKIQQIILLQKQQHDKRIRALEKLAHLERLHAQKLRNIMLNSQNDSLSSFIYDSFFQNMDPSSKDSTALDLDQLEREIKLLESSDNNNKSSQKRQSCINQSELLSREKNENNIAMHGQSRHRRNSEYYASSKSQKNNAFSAMTSVRREFSNLKNFTHDISPPPPLPPSAPPTSKGCVEILNFTNTAVSEMSKPEGVYVIKENNDSYKIIQNNDKVKNKQRVFFTLEEQAKTPRPFSPPHSHQEEQRQSPLNQPTYKFTNPIYPLKVPAKIPTKHHHHASSSSLSSTASSSTTTSTDGSSSRSSSFKSCGNLKLKSTLFDHHLQGIKSHHLGATTSTTASININDKSTMDRNAQVLINAQNTINAMGKMSLQEAFETFKYDLIARSRKRQTEIEQKAKQRQNFIDYERKLAELNGHHQKGAGSAKPSLGRTSHSASNVLLEKNGGGGGSRENYFEVNDVLQSKQKRRVMSAQEIKEMTKKNYSKLPEVKQKQVKQRLEQNKKLNLIKSSIYKKTIQQQVLAKGPNFKMKFRALEDAI